MKYSENGGIIIETYEKLGGHMPDKITSALVCGQCGSALRVTIVDDGWHVRCAKHPEHNVVTERLIWEQGAIEEISRSKDRLRSLLPPTGTEARRRVETLLREHRAWMRRAVDGEDE